MNGNSGDGLAAVCVVATTLWRGPEAPRDCDQMIVAGHPDPADWLNAMDPTTRRGLHGRAESQLLLGEPVAVLGRRDDWIEVAAPWQPTSADDRGYPGWLPAAHVREDLPASYWDAEQWAVVVTPDATMTTTSGRRPVSWSTWLPVDGGQEHDDESHQVVVRIPSGGEATVPAGCVEVHSSPLDQAPTPAEITRTARQFLGLEYLWGGTTGWGLDCSGLVHLAYRRFGVHVPRDARDQHPFAEPVDVDQVRVGDLYFFAARGAGVTHVGFATSDAASGVRTMLHAPEDDRLVEDTPMSPARAAELVAAGRITPDD